MHYKFCIVFPKYLSLHHDLEFLQLMMRLCPEIGYENYKQIKTDLRKGDFHVQLQQGNCY